MSHRDSAGRTMRTVFVHLKNASESEIEEWLSSLAGRLDDGQWRYPDAITPILYFEFYPNYKREAWPEDYSRLANELGNEPSTTLVSHVSGTVPGTSEVRQFVTAIL